MEKDDDLGEFASTVPDNDLGEFASVVPKKQGAISRFANDMGVALGKGAIAVPEALVGLADIPTGGAIGKLAEQEYGFKPKEWKEKIGAQHSPEYQADAAAVQQAEGFVPTVVEAIKRPQVIAGSIVESLPSTIVGGAIGRGARAAGVSPYVAGGVGEGAISAGLTAEQVRQQTPDGLLTGEQAAIAAGSGAVTGIIGGASNKVASKLGLTDVDNVLVGGVNTEVRKGIVPRVATGAAVEGAIEELPQSAQEQAAQNLALDRPVMEGVGNAAGIGMLTGAGMGAAVNIPGPLTTAAATAQAEQAQRLMPFKSQEAAKARMGAMQTANPGQQFEIAPHPTVGGAFAIVPVTEAKDGVSAKTGSVDADVQGGGGLGPDSSGGYRGDDREGSAGVVAEQPAPGRPAIHRPGDLPDDVSAQGSTNDVRPGAGNIERAAAAAGFVPNGTDVSTDAGIVNTSAQPVDAVNMEPTNVGASKVDPENLRMESFLDAIAHTAASSTRNERNVPTDPQKDANNTKLGHGEFKGLPIRIENPQGSIRAAKADDPVQWKTRMTEHYGYLAGTKGADGAGIDAFFGPKVESDKVFVVDQTIDGQFDEHKVMFGFDTMEEAKAAYYDNYQAGWKGGEAIHETTVDGLKEWLKVGDTTMQFGDITPVPAPAVAGAPEPVGFQSQPAGQAAFPSQPAARPAPPAQSSATQPLGAQSSAPTEAERSVVLDPKFGGNVERPLASPNKGVDADNTALSPVKTAEAPNKAVNLGQKPKNSAVQLQNNIKNEVPPFKNKLEATQYARANMIDADVVTTASGEIALAPKARPLTLKERQEAKAAVERLNRSLTDEGVQVRPVERLTAEQATVRALVKQAFDTDLHFVSGNKVFHGIALGGKAYMTPMEGKPLLNYVFHEVAHTMQHNDPDLSDRLYNYVRGYMKDGLVDVRIDLEFKAASRTAPDASKVKRVSEEIGVKEAMADINGALATDPTFWKKMAEYDASLFRKVAYKFMELLTKAIEVARGSHFDIDRMVTDRDMVASLVAAAWAEYNGKRKDKAPNGQNDTTRSAARKQTDTPAVPERRGVRGGAGVLARPSGSDSRNARALEGLPTPVRVNGQEVAFGPHQPARDAAERYMQKAGLQYNPQKSYVKVDKARAKRIAAEFDMMAHNPQDPAVKASYDAMIAETLAQYQEIKATGLKVEFIDYAKQGDPYGNPRNAILDVVKNNHLWVFSTRDGFGGPNATLDVSDNPLLAETQEIISGQRALVNDIFRVVHDYFGHIKEGVGFRAEGEENAWQQHVRMYSDAAIPAMTSETRGQNSWVNFGPYGADNQTASGAETEYAPQKIGLMPEWTWKEGYENARQDDQSTQLRYGRKRLSETRESAPVAIKPQQSEAAQPIVGIHYGKQGDLARLSGRYNGTGISGREQARLKQSKDARIKQRIYFYNDLGGQRLPAKEAGLGNNLYAVKLGNLYDLSKDPAGVYPAVRGIKDMAERLNALESKIVDAGYDGYSDGRMTVVLDADVPVDFIGNHITESIQFSRKFYSALSNAVTKMPFDKEHKIKPAQAKMWLAARAKEGLFKQAEVEWSGLNEWLDLQDGKVHMIDIMEYLDNYGVKVEEVLYDGEEDLDAKTDFISRRIEEARDSWEEERSRERDEAKEGFSAPYFVTEENNEEGESFWMVRHEYDNYFHEEYDSEEEAIEAMDSFNDVARDEYMYDWERNQEGFDSDEAEYMAEQEWDHDNVVNETQYSDYALEGGENYKELLLTIPKRMEPGVTAADFIIEMQAKYNLPSIKELLEVMTEGEHAAYKAAQTFTNRAKAKPFKSAHWDGVKNIVAHIRFDDRKAVSIDLAGTKLEKDSHVLFVEEIQSDWAQVGKRTGFLGPDHKFNFPSEEAANEAISEFRRQMTADARALFKQRLLDGGYSESEADKNAQIAANALTIYDQTVLLDRQKEWTELHNKREEDYKNRTKPTPLGPFVTDTKAWVALAVKRMILEAVDKGYTHVAFVNGQQSADRYDLSKYVSRILYSPYEGGKYYEMSAVDKEGREVDGAGGRMDLDQIEDTYGKDIAEKIKAGEKSGEDSGVFYIEGDNLRAGGHGMIQFYDRIVPQVVNDVLKKVGGGKLQEMTLEAPPAADRDTIGQLTVNHTVGYQRAIERGTVEIINLPDGLDPAKGNWILVEHTGERGNSGMKYNLIAQGENLEMERMKREMLEATRVPLKQLGFEITDKIKASVDNGLPLFSRKAPEWVNQVPGMTPDIAAKVGAWVPKKTAKQRWAELKADFGKKTVQGLVDQFAPIKQLDMKSYILSRLSKSADGGIEAMLKFGKLSMDADGAITVDRSGGFSELMAKLQGEQDRFFAWVAGNRAAQLKAEGRENLFDLPEIAALKSANQGTMPDGSSRAMLYAKVNMEMNAFGKSILDIAERTGIIDGASRAVWEKDFYVPFYRLREDGDNFSPVNVKGLANQQGIKRLKGGKENLNDLMQNTVLNWAHLLSASLKNHAAASTMAAAERVGAAKHVTSSASHDLFVLENGSKKFYQVDDPYLLAAVSSLGFTGFRGVIMDAASAAKRALSFGVTFSPSYRLRNIIRDQLQAVAVNPLSFNVGKNLVEGVMASGRDAPLYANMLAGGALFRMGAAYEDNRAAHLKREIAKLDPAMILDTPDKVKAVLGKAFDAYMETGERAEAATRASIYKQAIDAGKSHLEASYLARDSMDFGLQGSWAAVRVLSQVVPFFNARMQGMYKLGRGVKENPKRFAVVVGAATAATLALMLANYDDEEWKKREEWDRDTYWWFRIGETAYRIPKPFEIGALASVAERGLEMVMDGMDEKARERFASRLGSIVLNNLSMNVTPQLLKPAIDVYSNRDPFRQRPIENMGDERLSPSERQNADTSALAVIAGKADLLSPKQIDYMIQGYFGWLGAHLVMATDYMLNPMMDRPERAARKLDDIFVAGDWAKELPSNQSRFVSEFYEQAKKIQQAVADINHAKNIGDFDKAKDLIADNKELLKRRSVFGGATRQIGNINKRIRQIEASRTMTAEQKRSEIDRLSELRNTLAERVVSK